MISSTLPIHASDSRSQLIRDASLIIWDEAPMTSKAVLSCMEEVCRNAAHSFAPFGGKTIILLGDFRQTCPVIRRGSKSDVVQASIKSSPLWPLFQLKHLTQLIRNAEDPDYANFINDIGNGAGPDIDITKLLQAHSKNDLIDFVFPEDVLRNPFECLSRSILV